MMLRRLCSVIVCYRHHHGASTQSRAIVLRQTTVLLLNNDDAGRRLAEEAKATWDESQRMEKDLQSELCTVSAPLAQSSTSGKSNTGDWTEPTLDDLDRSIPQVDCAFIADLIRSRNQRRKDFLVRKSALKMRVWEQSKRQASSVAEAATYPLAGALGVFSSGRGNHESDALVTGPNSGGDEEAPVAVAPEVLAELSSDERDVLLSSRPEYNDGFVLLDCRTVNEVTSWGMIEGAKVLPAHEMFDGFHLTPEEFMNEFGFAKPRPDQRIICYCQYGPRSLMAAQILSWMGYANVLHFRDGYYEWSKQYNLLLRRWMQHDADSGNELRRQAAFQAGLELQREIAPEFNALPQQEASRYVLDTSRSRGTLRVGDGVREEAIGRVADLVAGMRPAQIPGVVDNAGSTSAAVGQRENQMRRFLLETTGMDGTRTQEGAAMGLAEAQEKVLDAFTRRDGGRHAVPPPRG